MNTAIAEFNLLYPRFEAHSFNTQCEVVETNPRNLQRLSKVRC